MRRFQTYRWPGNVRELRNTLESMMVLADGEVADREGSAGPDRRRRRQAAGAARRRSRPDLTMEELEKLAITKRSSRCAGNRTHAARAPGISVRTLQRKLRQYELEKAADHSPGRFDSGADRSQ